MRGGIEPRRHDGHDGRGEKMKCMEPHINADERRKYLLAYICAYPRFHGFLHSLGALGVLGGSNEATWQDSRIPPRRRRLTRPASATSDESLGTLGSHGNARRLGATDVQCEPAGRPPTVACGVSLLHCNRGSEYLARRRWKDRPRLSGPNAILSCRRSYEVASLRTAPSYLWPFEQPFRESVVGRTQEACFLERRSCLGGSTASNFCSESQRILVLMRASATWASKPPRSMKRISPTSPSSVRTFSPFLNVIVCSSVRSMG